MKDEELSLKEIQKAALIILQDVSSFCSDNGIKYFLGYGTLLGAIRHKGFIPWDDDIDIVMMREEYDRFLELYAQVGKYRIVNYMSEPNVPYMITRISDDDYTMKFDYATDYKIGVFIDVYPFDGLGNTMSDAQLMAKSTMKFARGLGKCLDRSIVGSISTLHRGIKKWALLPSYIIPKMRGIEYYRKRLERQARKHSINDSDYVGCAIWDLSSNTYYKKEYFEKQIEVEFEGITFSGPLEYDRVLSQQFGEYMLLPPEKDRIPHHFYKVFKA